MISPDPEDVYRSVPFAGGISLRPQASEGGRPLLRGLRGLILPACVAVAFISLQRCLPGAAALPKEEPLPETYLEIEIGAPAEAAPPAKIGVLEVVPADGEKEDAEPASPKTERVGVSQASRNSQAPHVVAEEPKPEPFLLGEQLPDRPTSTGRSSGAGQGARGSNTNNAPASSVGSLLGVEGGGGSSSSGSGGSSGRQGAGAGSGAAQGSVGSFTVEDMWVAAAKARGTSATGISPADRVAAASSFLTRSWPSSSRTVGDWIVATRGSKLCAGRSDGTVVCAERASGGGLRTTIGGAGSGQYATTERALVHLARLLGMKG